ncbi:MAG: hypothetical protein U5L09_22850 [Bacteroidales bacterium]|nr:hypothetical protein [Bacteroidales bacterium]
MELTMYNVYGEGAGSTEIADYFSSRSSFQLDMSPYPAGIYLIRCNVRGDVSEYKVFKESLKE